MSRRHPSVLLGCAFTSLLPLTAAAATLRVGPSRSHTTLNDIADIVQPGDVVEVDGDATYAGGVQMTRSGTESQPIVVRGVRVNGKRPVLSGGVNTVEIFASHYVFEGFDLTGGTSRCFFHHGHDITLRDSVVHDCPAHGVLGADNDSGSLLMEYVEVYRCGSGTTRHSIYMATDESVHPGAVFRMQFCYVHDTTGGNAVKSRAERNEIYFNWIEGGTYHELELIGPDPNGNPVPEDLRREDSDVVGNVLRKTNTFSVVRFGGDGTGQSQGRYRFVNNTVIVNPGGGAVFRLFDGLESVEMHNNVFYATAGGTVNLKREVEAVWTTGSAVIAGSNNWVMAGSTNSPPTWTGTITGSVPGFANEAALDFRIVEGGPLVNAGNDAPAGPIGFAFPLPLAGPTHEPPLHTLLAPGTATARTVSDAIDIGAFELTGAPGGSSSSPSSSLSPSSSAVSVSASSGAVSGESSSVAPSSNSAGDSSSAVPASSGVLSSSAPPSSLAAPSSLSPSSGAAASSSSESASSRSSSTGTSASSPVSSSAASFGSASSTAGALDGGTGTSERACSCDTTSQPGAPSLLALAALLGLLRRNERRDARRCRGLALIVVARARSFDAPPRCGKLSLPRRCHGTGGWHTPVPS